MTGVQQQVHRIVAEVHPGEPLVDRERHRRPVLDQCQVHLATGHQVRRRVRIGLQQAYVQVGAACAQLGEYAREQAACAGREGRDHQPPEGPTALLLQRHLGLFDQGEDLLGGSGQPPGGVGEDHAPALALQQGGPGLPFQLGDLLGDRRGCEAECGGRAAHRAVHRDRVQGPEPS
ncbi:hypothetical protein GCM10010430_68920 [Kitasatospora cystarginea]|uniref:Uncharacterized protein n=1 Tax=Kitasatospora cystarginea TaxID=58350 RepID=A0ABN3EW37_9ACTN